MVRTTTDDATDAKPATDEAFDIIDEARDVLGDEHVADAMAEYDGDVRLAAADLSDAVCDEEDRRMAEAFGVDTDDVDPEPDFDVPDAFGETVDLSDYKTASGAAKAAGRKMKAIAEEVGHKPDVEVTVRREELRDGHKWVVYYPAGEHDWAVRMTGGTSVYGMGGDPVLTGFYGAGDWSIECEHGTALAFYPR